MANDLDRAPLRPPALRPGDTVAIVSPSWGGPASFPHVYQRGLDVLEQEFALRIKEYPTARMPADALHADPRARAADINAAFADQEVAAIIATIGGDDSVRILPYLDTAAIRASPKILLGYSDTTTLLTYINQLGMVTFNGPSVMAGLSQLRSLPSACADHLRALLFGAPETYAYAPYEWYAEGYPDWSDPAMVGHVNPALPNPAGWRWLQGAGVGIGSLFGGCIEVLEFLKSTDFWPAPTFWDGKILFFETSEEVPTPQQVMYMLRNYGMQGVFDRVVGVLFGRPRGYDTVEKQQLEAHLVAVIAGEFGHPELPIVANMDFGHTDPQLVLPLGVRAAIDCDRRTVRLIEPACARPRPTANDYMKSI
jgi:muramoyltetrapeptide carboxypeptidase LdcA involved in peptidoglycan recycling